MKRRQFLASTAAGVGGALAGCTDSLGDIGGSGGSLPEYHTGLPARPASGGQTTFVHADVGRLADLGLFETPTGTETPTETATDDESDDPATPLLAAPLVGSVFTLAFGLGFGLAGFGALGERLNGMTDAASETDVSTVTFGAGAVALRGSFETDSYAVDLPDSFSETTTRDGVTVYEHSDDETLAAALGSEMLVLSFVGDGDGATGVEAVTSVLEAEAGERARLADRDADTDWALRTAGAHGFVVGGERGTADEAGESESVFDPLAGTPLADVETDLLVSGASVESAGEQVNGASSDLAVTHSSSPVDESTLTDVYTDSEADVSVSVADAVREGGQRVSIAADFADRDIGL